MRRLQHRQFRVLEEPAHGDLQKRAGRHVVGIKHGDVFAIGGLERFVQVTGLGVVIVFTGQVANTDLLAELAKVFSAAVIKYVDTQFVSRPINGLRRKNGQFDDAQRFVVRRDKHIHSRPLTGIARHDHRLAVQRPGGLHITQHDDDQRVELGDDQPVAQQAVQPVIEIKSRGQPPVHVPKRRQQRQRHQRQHRNAPRHLANHQHRGKTGQGKKALRVEVQRHGDDQRHQQQADNNGHGFQCAAQGSGLLAEPCRQSIQPQR